MLSPSPPALPLDFSHPRSLRRHTLTSVHRQRSLKAQQVALGKAEELGEVSPPPHTHTARSIHPPPQSPCPTDAAHPYKVFQRISTLSHPSTPMEHFSTLPRTPNLADQSYILPPQKTTTTPCSHPLATTESHTRPLYASPSTPPPPPPIHCDKDSQGGESKKTKTRLWSKVSFLQCSTCTPPIPALWDCSGVRPGSNLNFRGSIIVQ